jgi:hypothetical protein
MARDKSKTSPAEALRFELAELMGVSKQARRVLAKQIKTIEEQFGDASYENKLKSADTMGAILRGNATNMAAIARALQSADELKGHETADSEMSDEEMVEAEESTLLGGGYGG